MSNVPKEWEFTEENFVSRHGVISMTLKETASLANQKLEKLFAKVQRVYAVKEFGISPSFEYNPSLDDTHTALLINLIEIEKPHVCAPSSHSVGSCKKFLLTDEDNDVICATCEKKLVATWSVINE